MTTNINNSPEYACRTCAKQECGCKDTECQLPCHFYTEQAEQEPVAWYGKSRTGNILLSVNCVDEDWQPLYAKPIEPVRPEPIGDVDIHMDFLRINWKDGRHPPRGTKLYAAPVRTKDLTDDEIDRIACNVSHKEFARAVIAADREKNK